MEYQCFVCFNFFPSEKEAIAHLKKSHFIKENINPIYCLKKCKYYCFTFRQLKIHMKSCQHDDSDEQNNEISERAIVVDNSIDDTQVKKKYFMHNYSYP